MNGNALADLAEELVTRPFPDGPVHGSGWLDGSAQSGPEAHLAPIAMQESLYETPADHDGTIGEPSDDVYDKFEQRRLRAVGSAAAVLIPGGAGAGNGERLQRLDAPL
ncbi:hypothetical protein [Dactylosporangium sp. CA-233914]|uniref:hypothetical protein n=1 Tax=Dactylosporangium sp. CA-233914 TaxID=3239934 RepID=UPI003D8B5A95